MPAMRTPAASDIANCDNSKRQILVSCMLVRNPNGEEGERGTMIVPRNANSKTWPGFYCRLMAGMRSVRLNCYDSICGGESYRKIG